MTILKNISKKILILLFWIWVWLIIALIVDNELLIPGPDKVFLRLLELMLTSAFWTSIFTSLYRVMLGIIVAIVLGVALGYLSYKFSIVHDVLSPVMTIARATPVASFIILIALFIGAITVPTIITIIMVLPIIWINTYTGFNSINKDLKEVCSIYKLTGKQQLKALYLPAIMPHFTSAVLSSIGLGWKAGIAAEILFPPLKSIGKAIYESNWLLKTTDLFAWTLAVILLSILFEALAKLVIKLTSRKNSGGKQNENN